MIGILSKMAQPNSTPWQIVLSEWNRAHGPRFELRQCDLAWNMREQDLVEYRVAILAGVPVIHGIASLKGIEQGLSANSIWLGLWGEIRSGVEKEFLEAFAGLAKTLGRSRLVFGADEFHFVPGIPIEAPAGERLKSALIANHFEGAEASDFIGPANSAEVQEYIRQAAAESEASGWRFQAVLSELEKDALGVFLAKEFAGRWTREFQFWRSRADTDRAFWSVLKKESDEILGFARMAKRDRLLPLDRGWTPGALRLPLRTSSDEGRNWSDHDACLGPIGVANSQRGKGAGRVLLGRVLETLGRLNSERICVDWTNAIKYYQPLRFEMSRSYWTAWKSGFD